jgi:hypothetical protein
MRPNEANKVSRDCLRCVCSSGLRDNNAALITF